MSSWETAITSFSRGGFVQAHINLGFAHARLGEHDEAVGAFRQAIRMQPDVIEGHMQLGKEYLAQEKFSVALFLYTPSGRCYALDEVRRWLRAA